MTREERLVVKPLYDRYRLVKQMLTRVSITPVTVRTHKHHISVSNIVTNTNLSDLLLSIYKTLTYMLLLMLFLLYCI